MVTENLGLPQLNFSWCKILSLVKPFLTFRKEHKGFMFCPAVRMWTLCAFKNFGKTLTRRRRVEYVWNVTAHSQKPDLVFQRNGRVPFKLAWGSVQSTTGSRGVRISGSNGSNAGYTMLWGRVQDYCLTTPLTCCHFTSPTVRHRVPSGFNWAVIAEKSYELADRNSTHREGAIFLFVIPSTTH